MSVIGIIGEYNPFHLGHEYHIKETKRALGEDAAVVSVLSGDFVQRGEAAVYDKFTRAEAAIMGGADLVLELPLPWAISSAEGFARGGVGLLNALGVVTHLSFGSECGDIGKLSQLAEVLNKAELIEDIKRRMSRDGTLSFASARMQAVEAVIGDAAGLLNAPNNILAVEYLKAMQTLNADMTPVTAKRIGAGHDEAGAFPPSASQLRSRLYAGESITDGIPEAVFGVYAKAQMLDRDAMEIALMSRLRMLPDAVFEQLPDAGAGLSNRLMKACREETSLDAIAMAAKSKHYALSRIRRMSLCAALGVTAEMSRGIPPYARVLAANRRGCALLREINENSSVPVLTKPATVRDLGTDCEALFTLGAHAHDLYHLGTDRKGGMDWKTGPKIACSL